MCEGYVGLQGDKGVTPHALLLVLARRRRWAALDGRNNPRSPKINRKALTQQSTGGIGCVGSAGGRSGLYKYKKVVK